MKELKTRLQDTKVSLVSVCCSIDVVAVANGSEIIIYRMPLSKISSTTLESSVRCLCWSPNGRTLCAGTDGGMALINVEDGSVIRTSLQKGIVDIKWVSGLQSEAKKDRPLLFLEANFNPLLLPLQDSVDSTANNSITGQVIEEAMTSLSQQHYHFVLALTDDGTVHVSPYGIMNMLRVQLPDATSISSFHLLRSVVYTVPGAMKGVNVSPLYKFKDLCKAAVHHSLLKESLEVILASCAHIRSKAEEAEKEVLSILGPSAPDLAGLFTKGPMTEDDHIWVNNKCEPSRMQKTVDIFTNNMSDVCKLLAGNVAPQVDYVCCLGTAVCNVLPCNVYGGLCTDLAELHTQVTTAACGVAKSQEDAVNLLAWILEMHKCCTKPKTAQQIEDCPTYDTKKVLDIVFRPANWSKTTADIDAIVAAVQRISTALDASGDTLCADVSRDALAGTVGISAGMDFDSEASLSSTCSRYYTSIADDKVIITVVPDEGPKATKRWCALKGYLPIVGCRATSFYSNKAEDELKLLTLSEGDGTMTLTMFYIIAEGELTAHYSPSKPVELMIEPCGVHVLQLPFDSPEKLMLSSSTRGLACVAATHAESSYVSMIDLEDEEEEEGAEEGEEVDE